MPYFSGERTPINDLHAKGLVFGLNLSHSRAHLYRSCLEGIGYGLRHNIEAMGEADATPKRLVAIGGGVQESALAANLQRCDRSAARCAHARTIGAAYGDAYLAGMAAGVFDDFGALHDTWVEIAHRVDPNPEAKEIYDDMYHIYRDLYRDTRRHMARLSTLP